VGFQRARRSDNSPIQQQQYIRRIAPKGAAEMNESLTKAEHSAGFLMDELRDALHKATSVQGIVILDMIERAAKLNQEIKALHNAVECDTKGNTSNLEGEQ